MVHFDSSRQRHVSPLADIPRHIETEKFPQLHEPSTAGCGFIKVGSSSFKVTVQPLSCHERPQNIGGAFSDPVHFRIAHKLFYSKSRSATEALGISRLITHSTENDLCIFEELDRSFRAEQFCDRRFDPDVIAVLVREMPDKLRERFHRGANVTDAIEKFSVIKTLQAIEDANVVILVLDARDQIVDQDAHIAGYIVEAGRALVVAVNKWDGLRPEQRESAKHSLERTLNFIDFAPVHYISALAGTGIKSLLDAVERAYRAAMIKLPTPKLTRALEAAIARQAPPRGGIFRPKMRYAHQGGSNPPRIIIHGTGLNRVSDSYRRYLEHFFRDAFELLGTPLKIEFRQGVNPYDKRRGKR